MAGSGGHGVRLLVRYVGWLVISGVASCGYQELPRLTGADAAGDAPDVDGPPRPPQFTSCMGLAATCGAGANASCCDPAVTVPGGTFHRSYDGTGNNDTGYPATVSPFVLDKYEVTVGRFRAFVKAGQGTQASPPGAGAGAHPKLAGSGWDSAWNTNLATDRGALVAAVKCHSTYQAWTDDPDANENKPMNCVSWYEAMAFCIWDGGYLPTEAEWNYAASGGSEQRAYPWSNPSTSTSIDCTYANYYVNSPAGMYCVNNTTGAVNRVGSESQNGDGKWGHSDLAGNVWEWTLDWYVSSYPLPCNDCANLTASSSRVIRGGSFYAVASDLRAAYRVSSTPTDRVGIIGLRCARTP
jgi:formylglycine-generating enzyme required for sulfatase activity